MHDPLTFESRLADAYERYLVGAPIAVDPVALAASLAAARPRRQRFSAPLFAGRPTWAVVTILAMLLLALVGTILLVGRLLDRPQPIQPYRGVFAPAGQLEQARANAVAVTLADGRVLIAGGPVGEVLPAEVFDPSTGRVTPTTGDIPKGSGSSIVLGDGRVLSIHYDSNGTSSNAYVFDPVAMRVRRLDYAYPTPFGYEPSMALLQDGRVVVSGGDADLVEAQIQASALIFDPATETFSPTGSMLEARRWHAMTTLPDGRVLVAAGEAQEGDVSPDDVGSHLAYRSWVDTAELYDAASGTFTSLGKLPSVHGAALGCLLSDGRILLLPRGTTNDGYWLQMATSDRIRRRGRSGRTSSIPGRGRSSRVR